MQLTALDSAARPLRAADAVRIPPAEDWVRTPLLRGTWIDEQPVGEPVLFTAASRSRLGWGPNRDQRGLLTDFVYVGGRSTAFEDVIRGAAAFSKEHSEGNIFISPRMVTVLRGRDGTFWAVPITQGVGDELIFPDDPGGRPSFEYGVGRRIEVDAKQDNVVALVDEDSYADLRNDINGAWSWNVQPVPAAPATVVA